MVDRHVEWVASMLGKRGFTLVEMIVTIAVLAIIAGMAAPAMNRLLAEQQLNKNARELSAILYQARSQSVLIKRNITINLNSELANTSTTLNWMPTGNTIYDSTGPTSVVLLPSGRVQTANNNSQDVTLRICETSATGAKAKLVVVSFMGSISQAEGTCP